MAHREITWLAGEKANLQERPRVGGIHWCALHQRFARVSCICSWVPFHVEYSDYDCPGDDPWVEAAMKEVPDEAKEASGHLRREWLDNQ